MRPIDIFRQVAATRSFRYAYRVDKGDGETLPEYEISLDERDAGVLVDMQTASACVKVYDAVNLENKKKLDKMTLTKFVDTAWQVLFPGRN